MNQDLFMNDIEKKRDFCQFNILYSSGYEKYTKDKIKHSINAVNFTKPIYDTKRTKKQKFFIGMRHLLFYTSHIFKSIINL